MSAGRRIAGALLIAAFVAIGIGALAGTVESHSGHPQKKLFPEERWHYQPDGDYGAWMNLSTSDVWLNCDGSAAACGAKWDGPFTSSMADWNGQPTTVRFDYADGIQNTEFDVDVYIEDEIPGGGGGLLGFAPTYDINGVLCSSSCVVYSGIVYIGDDPHSGYYGTANDRLATISHEMGHIVQLAHESTNPGETQVYACGTDDTGPIPHSVMAYECIDPVAIGGLGESFVQPWDVCGVNHAYNDPALGFTGCDLTTITATPSPTPPAEVVTWADNNCSLQVNPVDSLFVLRGDAGLPTNTGDCPDMGQDIEVLNASPHIWGDVDCSGGMTPVDSLKILRYDAGLSASQAANCPLIGSQVLVTE